VDVADNGIGVWQINWLGILVGPLDFFGIEYVFVLGLVSIAIATISKVVASGILMLTVPFLKYFLELCRWMSSLGFGVWEYEFNWLMVVGWYFVLLSIFLKRIQSNDHF